MSTERWSSKKRIKFTLIGTGVIFCIALIVGYMLFLFATKTGLVKPLNFRTEVAKSLATDKQFARAIEKTLSGKECTNAALHFTFLYTDPLWVEPSKIQDQECLVIVGKGAQGVNVRTALRMETGTKPQVIEAILVEFKTVETQVFTHPLYEASKITGIRNGMRSTVVVMNWPTGGVLSVDYGSADPVLERAIDSVIKSIRYL